MAKNTLLALLRVLRNTLSGAVQCCPPCFDCPLYLFLSGCCCSNRLLGAWMELQITFPCCHAATQAARLP